MRALKVSSLYAIFYLGKTTNSIVRVYNIILLLLPVLVSNPVSNQGSKGSYVRLFCIFAGLDIAA